MHPATDTADREIILKQTFAAPRDLVFAAWTDRKHIAKWWGPNGFTTTTERLELRPGGLWVYTMHGPDGTDYPNWIRYHEIDRPARLVYDHGGEPDTPALFHVTITFVETAGKTEVTMHSVFPTAAARDEVVQRYGAIEGGKQHLARLGEHLVAMASDPANPRCQRRFTRRFAAPLDLVFAAWTDPKHLVHWWGPHDFTNPVCRFDARVGGRIHIDMCGPDGVISPMVGEVREFQPPHRLVFHALPLDAQGGARFSVVNSIQFAEAGGFTTVTVDTEVTCLSPDGEIPYDGMQVGWTQSLDRLNDLLTNPAAAQHSECDIVTTRVIKAPRAQVFAAWTNPAQLQRWWGPNGFTNTFSVFELKPGGDWRFVMRSPDGTEFPNHCVFREIVADDLLVFDHCAPVHAFEVRANFYDFMGGTLVRFRMRFTDAAECARVRSFVVPANEQNFDRLEGVLGLRPG